MKKEKTLEISAEFLFSYDNESPEFKQALENFIEYIDETGTEQTLLEYISYNIGGLGLEEIVDCIGRVSINGVKPKHMYCGIDVQCDTDCLDNLIFEVN